MTIGIRELRDLVADWLIEYRSPKTRESYRRTVYQFASWLGRDVTAATRSDIRRFVAYLSSVLELKDASVRQKTSALASFFSHLTAEGIIDQNPAVEIRRPQGESEPRLALEPHDARKFMAEAEAHSRVAAALAWLMGGAALRVTEACTARIEDLNGDLLVVRVKGGHRQIKVLSPPVLAAVHNIVGDRTEGPIVVDSDGRPVKPWWVQKVLIPDLAARAGITDDFTPHTLRHTAATLALDAGARLEDVQALLGHKSPETTMRYVRNRDVVGGTRKAAHALARTLVLDGEEMTVTADQEENT